MFGYMVLLIFNKWTAYVAGGFEGAGKVVFPLISEKI
jgi:hypothetical protein